MFFLFTVKTVTVREIRANSEYTDSMVGFKTPVLNDFTGECFKRQIKDFGDELAIKIEDFETAYKTLPEEKHRFSSLLLINQGIFPFSKGLKMEREFSAKASLNRKILV